MNPVPLMELVELIRGIATDDATFKAGARLHREARQDRCGVEDFPAFIVNRILLPMINEAIYTLYEGVGTVERSTRPCGSAPTTRWGRWSSPTSSASTPVSSVMQVLTRGWPIPNTAPARCW